MANLIVEKSRSINLYTDLQPFFSLIEPVVRKHRWLWSDVDVYAELPIADNDCGWYLIDGDTLFDFVQTRPQFVWSVLSALRPDAVVDPGSSETVPYADGNPDFWHGSPRPQCPDAEFEVVCWDASATLLIGADETVANAFRMAYSDAHNLDDLNTPTKF